MLERILTNSASLVVSPYGYYRARRQEREVLLEQQVHALQRENDALRSIIAAHVGLGSGDYCRAILLCAGKPWQDCLLLMARGSVCHAHSLPMFTGVSIAR